MRSQSVKQNVTAAVTTRGNHWDSVAAMVTETDSETLGPPYLRAHREAKKVSATKMGDALGIERESVYRLERELERVTTGDLTVYADMLRVPPIDLWRLPDDPSLDAIMAGQPKGLKAKAVRILQELVDKD